MSANLKIPVGEDRQMDRRITAPSVFKSVIIPATILISGLSLTACGSSATHNAQQACHYVQESISQYNLGKSQTDPAVRASYQKKALVLLGKALPLAAIAAGANGEYQALQTTLSQASRVPESLLINALTRQCAQILPNSNQQVPGGYVPPANVNAGQ